MIVHFERFFKCFPKRGVKMPKAAVICEFNPFHNGHKILLENIKREYGADIVCIMSGSFVQRGDIAVTDKYARTAAALKNGADMVVELPTVYAVGSAQVFAENGVRIAADLGCDLLCFGAENSIKELYSVVNALNDTKIQSRIAMNMKAGAYYPQAVSGALDPDAAQILGKPNNILAVEYIRACEKHGVTPVAFPRTGADHDEAAPVGNIASASAIRDMIRSGEPYGSYTPMAAEHPAFIEAIEPAILFALKTIDKDELALLADVGEGLENRIYDAAIRYNSIEEISTQIKTKRYTMARIRRILIYALLGITRRLQETPVPYIRILGVGKNKPELLKSSDLPLIVDVKRGYDELHFSQKEIFNIDLKAAELMNIAQRNHINNEFTRGVIKL